MLGIEFVGLGIGCIIAGLINKYFFKEKDDKVSISVLGLVWLVMGLIYMGILE